MNLAVTKFSIEHLVATGCTDIIVEGIKKLEAENARLRKATAWQPLVTAPFDPNVRIMVFTFSKEIEIIYSTDLRWFDNKDHIPTCWMPIPNPPDVSEVQS